MGAAASVQSAGRGDAGGGQAQVPGPSHPSRRCPRYPPLQEASLRVWSCSLVVKPCSPPASDTSLPDTCAWSRFPETTPVHALALLASILSVFTIAVTVAPILSTPQTFSNYLLKPSHHPLSEPLTRETLTLVVREYTMLPICYIFKSGLTQVLDL